MILAIELDREVDGRWIAEVAKLNLLVYGATREDAVRRAERSARELIADRVAQGELPKSASQIEFAVAA